MIHTRNILLLIVLSLFAASCDNEIDVTAEWKEIPVVYGLIDPAAQYNYIRVNRVYLNEEGDARSFAKVADSINFDQLSVSLTEYIDGVERNTIQFEKVLGDTIGLPKDDGLFATTPNILYRSDYDFLASDFRQTVRYELLILNEESGKIYRSETLSPGFAEAKTPIRRTRKSINISDGENSNIAITYIEGIYVRSYDLVVRFRYEEFPKSDTFDKHIDSVDWVVFTDKETKRLTGYVEKSVIVDGAVFYQIVGASIEEDTTVLRRPLDMAFIYYGATEDLYTYINVNKPSIGIVQKKPEFTNIENGLGVFAGRYVNWYDDIYIRPEMRFTLAGSQYTKHLNFVTN